MTTVWHIIQKDLRRIAWLLAIWCACGICMALPNFKLSTTALVTGKGGIFLPLILLVAYGVTTIAMIVDVIQNDHPKGNSFWRTRPVSPARLLGAKLLLLALLFGVIQLLIQTGLRALLLGSDSLLTARSGGAWWSVAATYVRSPLLPIAGGVLSLAAIAACSENGGRFILIATGCWVSSSALSMGLGHLEMAYLPRQLMGEIAGSKLLAMELFACAIAGAILCNEYFWRKTMMSYLLLGAGVLGLASISTLWRWAWI